MISNPKSIEPIAIHRRIEVSGRAPSGTDSLGIANRKRFELSNSSLESGILIHLMTKRDDKHNQRLAYHEAGHALVAWHLGYRIIQTTIEKSETTDAEGETTVIHPDANILTYLLGLAGITNEKDDDDHIAYLMAGVEAVRLVGCEKTISIEGSELSDDIVEARNDILKAIAIARRLGRGAKLLQDLAFESGKSKATVILEAHVGALNAIARSLVENKTLSGVEIAKIIESLPASENFGLNANGHAPA